MIDYLKGLTEGTSGGQQNGQDILSNLLSWAGGGKYYTPDLDLDAYKGAMNAVGQVPRSGAASMFNAGGGGGGGPSAWDKFVGGTRADGTDFNGWGGLALGAGQGIMGGWMGMQQLDQAKSQLDESKRQFNKNFEANRSTTNTQLRDRQKARVASNAGAYESVGKYMNKNGV